MKFKELLLREEPRQGGLVVPFRSSYRPLSVRFRSSYGPLSVRFRFVFGAVLE
jgi:hypothetical protein